MNVLAISGKIDFPPFCWGLFTLVWVISAFSVKPTKEHQNWGSRLITVSLMVIAILLLAGIISVCGLNTRILRDTFASQIIGDSIMLAGLVTAIWAHFSLGSNWSAAITFKEGHELIERGPYRFVRHPMYTGMLLMVLGTAIAVGRISALVAVTVFFFTVWQKLRQEEALLMKRFPEAYQRYMSRTKVLVPFLF
jgi:protein-S-isoprenylcysteine O-methyltransferase Ste14